MNTFVMSVQSHYQKKSKNGISMTTSQHVGKARQYADVVMNPDAAVAGSLIEKV